MNQVNKIGDAQSTLEVAWRWLPYGYAAEYRFTSALSADTSRELIAKLLREVLPEQCRSGETLTDVKGRDPQMSADRTMLGGNPPRREELFYISGTMPFQAEEKMKPSKNDTNEDEEPSQQFESAIYTKFLRFDGAKHIVYTVDRFDDGVDGVKVPTADLILNPEHQITSCRLGLEFFEARFATLIGFSPVVTQSLYVECSATKLALRIVGEGMKSKDTIPLPQDGTFGKLSSVLKQTLGFDMDRDLSAKLA